MKALDVLVRKNSEMMHEFSSRCIGRIEGHGLLKVLLAPFHRILEANVEKEVEKDRLIIECAAAAYADGTDLGAVSREALLEMTKHVDAAFLKNVSLPFPTDVRYQDIVDIREKRIDIMLKTASDLLKNWEENHSFSEIVRKTYSPKQFNKVISDMLHLYQLETRAIASSLELPPSVKKVKAYIEAKLYEIMELVAEEIASKHSERVFTVERLS
jgi:hypothetical protein